MKVVCQIIAVVFFAARSTVASESNLPCCPLARIIRVQANPIVRTGNTNAQSNQDTACLEKRRTAFTEKWRSARDLIKDTGKSYPRFWDVKNIGEEDNFLRVVYDMAKFKRDYWITANSYTVDPISVVGQFERVLAVTVVTTPPILFSTGTKPTLPCSENTLGERSIAESLRYRNLMLVIIPSTKELYTQWKQWVDLQKETAHFKDRTLLYTVSRPGGADDFMNRVHIGLMDFNRFRDCKPCTEEFVSTTTVTSRTPVATTTTVKESSAHNVIAKFTVCGVLISTVIFGHL